MENNQPKILIAGVGNDLRQDDAFGIELARMLLKDLKLPPNVKVLEVGIGGIHMVQELFDNYDMLLLLDAVEWGGREGELYFKEIEVNNINDLPPDEKRDFTADTHYANPVRALMLAYSLGKLPAKVLMMGCEASLHDDFAMGMSEAVQQALPEAAQKIKDWLFEISTPVEQIV